MFKGEQLFLFLRAIQIQSLTTSRCIAELAEFLNILGGCLEKHWANFEVIAIPLAEKKAGRRALLSSKLRARYT